MSLYLSAWETRLRSLADEADQRVFQFLPQPPMDTPLLNRAYVYCRAWLHTIVIPFIWPPDYYL